MNRGIGILCSSSSARLESRGIEVVTLLWDHLYRTKILIEEVDKLVWIPLKKKKKKRFPGEEVLRALKGKGGERVVGGEFLV